MNTMTRPRRYLAALTIAAIALLAGCSTGDDQAVYGGSFTFVSPGGVYEFSYEPEDRDTIGALAGPDLMTGDTIDVTDYDGQVLAINFWGSWCPPCRAEQDGLSLISQQLEPEGVRFLGIDVGDPRSDGQDFHRSKNVPYPSIFDSTMRTFLALQGYPATAIPSMVVLDRQQRVAQIWLASATVPMGEMKARLAAIAAEAAESDTSAAEAAESDTSAAEPAESDTSAAESTP